MKAEHIESIPKHNFTSIDIYLRLIFGIIFDLFFQLLLLSLIIYNYMLLREKLQSITEALAEMTAEKSKDVTKKWFLRIFFLNYIFEKLLLKRINLLFMKRPSDMDKNYNCNEILRYNLEQLNINVFFFFKKKKRCHSKIRFSFKSGYNISE